MTGGGAGHRFAPALDGLYLACIWTAGIAIVRPTPEIIRAIIVPAAISLSA